MNRVISTVAALALPIVAAMAFVASVQPISPAAFVAAAMAPEPTLEPRLIGFGCGDKAQTLLRMEEDEFPRCDSIEPVAGEACRIPLSNGESVQLGAVDCRNFWGDGY